MLTDKELEQSSFDETSETNQLAEYWQIIVGKKWLVLSVTVLSLLVSLIYFVTQPDLYTTSVKILVEEPPESLKSQQDTITTAYRGQRDYYGTQIELLTGSGITQLVESEIGKLSGYRVWAQQVRDTRIITLFVKHTNPQRAADIANKFAEAYIKESSKQSFYVSEQFLKLIPEDAELYEESPVMEKLKGFSKQEFAESLSMVTSDPEIQKFRSEKLDIQAKLREASLRYKSQHPIVIDLSGRLTYVDIRLKDRMKKILENLRAKLTGEIAITNIRILEKAFPSGRPSEPNRPLGIFACTLLGFFTVSGAVIFLETTAQKIRVEQDLRPGIKLPFLGYIPLVKEMAMDLGKKKGKKKDSAPAAEGFSIVSILEKNKMLADAVASVRTHILFSMPYERSKRIMITSTLPGEGKSTVAALLALSLKALGRKILLVEADLRRPFIHSLLNVKNGKGLTDYLIGMIPFEEIIRNVPGSDLSVITSGSETPNPSELLASERFKEFLDKASQSFDRVVIDIAPVLYIPDGLIVAKYVHSGILVCGSGMVHKSVVRHVKEKFDSIGHSFIGIIINRADYEKEASKFAYFKSYKKYYSPKKPEAFTKSK